MSQAATLPATAFPVDSFKDAAPHLRRPFTPAAVKFKVQATWPDGGLIVAYIDARLVVERLNLIVPHLWHDAYRPLGGGQMWCDLTIDGITRSDVGEGAGKGLVSDALKRAAVRFGIGVSLYATPSLMLNNPHLKRKERGGKETVTINGDGMRVVRATYTAWLEQHGTKAFGEPLDHGDVDGAQGDHEADAPDVPAPAREAGLREDMAASLVLNADSAGIGRDALRKAAQHAYGGSLPVFDDDAVALDALLALSVSQGERVAKWIESKRQPVAA